MSSYRHVSVEQDSTSPTELVPSSSDWRRSADSANNSLSYDSGEMEYYLGGKPFKTDDKSCHYHTEDECTGRQDYINMTRGEAPVVGTHSVRSPHAPSPVRDVREQDSVASSSGYGSTPYSPKESKEYIEMKDTCGGKNEYRRRHPVDMTLHALRDILARIADKWLQQEIANNMQARGYKIVCLDSNRDICDESLDILDQPIGKGLAFEVQYF